MESKYYIPKIEEFHIGFECEYYNNHAEKFIPIIIDSSNFELNSMDGSFDDDYVLSYNYSRPNKFRVKYLDREAIEFFGFETEDLGDCYNLQIGFDLFGLYPFRFDTGNNNSYKITKDNETLFHGIIKNKSELKKLLIQLEIINE